MDAPRYKIEGYEFCAVPAHNGAWVSWADYDRLAEDRDFWKERFQIETRYRIELADKGTLQALQDANERAEKAEASRDTLAAALTEERDRLKEIVDGTGLATAAIAAERDRLAKANAELLAGLKPFGEAAEDVDDDDKDHWGIWEHPATLGLTIGDLRKARALLDKHKATSTEREGE